MDEPSWTFNSSNCSIDGIAGFKGRCQYRTELPVADWRAWRGDEYGNIRAFRTDARRVTRTTLYGGYVAGRFELADDLTLITGCAAASTRSTATTTTRRASAARAPAKTPLAPGRPTTASSMD